MTYAAYIPHIRPRPLRTNMRQNSTPEGLQFEPMDVTGNHDLVVLWVEMLVPPPRLANAASTSLLSPQPLQTNVRQHSTHQRRQFKPIDVSHNQDLVELLAGVLAALQMANAAYIAPISTRPLPTNMRRHSTPHGRYCKYGQRSLYLPRPLPMNMRPHSTPQGRHQEPMDVACNQDLVEIWLEMVAAPPPPHRWPSHLISLASGPALYRRLCARILLARGISRIGRGGGTGGGSGGATVNSVLWKMDGLMLVAESGVFALLV